MKFIRRTGRLMIPVTAAGALTLLVPGTAGAAGFAGKSLEEIASSVDTLWILVAGALVFFMQAGFFLLEGGLTRAKNVSNATLKGTMDFSLGALTYWVVGFGLMFGLDRAGLFGSSHFLASSPGGSFGGLPLYAFIFFQVAFAGAAATILAGGVSERMKFTSYLVATICVTGFIYPVAGHWIWGEGGWLARLGAVDFAGSTVVHTVGGVCALVGAWMVGARLGKYNRDGSPNAIPGHNIPMAALGTFILWLGWYGFNPGSTLSVSPAIATIAMTTTLAASAGAVTAMAVTWGRYGKPDVSMTLNGSLAGLVAITAGCANVSPSSAAVIGALAGVLVVFSVEFIDRRLRVDDPVGAVSVHAVNGIWGTLAVGLFAQAGFGEANGAAVVNGLFFGGGIKQLGLQALTSAATVAWVLTTAGLLFWVLKKTLGLRVDDAGQREGLDLNEHNVEAYPDFQPAVIEDKGVA